MVKDQRVHKQNGYNDHVYWPAAICYSPLSPLFIFNNREN